MQSEPSTETLRRDAMRAFLGAGMGSPPTHALIVSALANARRSVAAHQARGEPLDDWLMNETRIRGIRENAATLAALEVADMRDRVAAEYVRQHPDRIEYLREMLKYL